MKRNAPYILILIILVGLFSPMVGVRNAQAQTNPLYKKCIENGGSPKECMVDFSDDQIDAQGKRIEKTPEKAGDTAFETEVKAKTCGFGVATFGGSVYGCFVQIFYYVFFMLATFALWLGAFFFNTLVSIGLDSMLISNSSFVSAAWAVVRDLSNIFFILILLYIAIKMILGLGGAEVKKMIAHVVVMALLINFSMFFTKVVIDTTNILALVFYNKIDVETKNANGTKRPYPSVRGEKDITGGLIKSFNPTTLLTPEFFTKTKNLPGLPPTTEVPPGILIGIMLVSGVLMIYAAYCFFQVGVFFISRLIELWVLIIFSPFAFMSFPVPVLAKAEGIGWDDWSHRLLSVSFMAPIFMFFLYLIFLLISVNPFENIVKTNGGAINTIIYIIISALVILIILKKATEKAKKSAGELGSAVMTGAKVLGGLALGAATGGAAMAGRGLIGGVGGWAANKLASGANKLGDTKWGNRLGMNKLASGLTGVGAFAQKSSFDVRGIKVAGQGLSSVTGLSLGEAKKGGIAQSRKEKVEKRMNRADMLKVREDEGLKQALNKTEGDLQSLLNANSKELSELDKLIEKKREALRDVNARFGGGSPQSQAAGLELQNAKDRKKALKDGVNYAGDKDIAGVVTGANAKNYTNVNAGTYVDSAGITQIRTINHLEDIEIRDRKQDISDEDRRRRVAFAKRKGGWGWLSSTANKEARHKIIMESKIESKGESH